MAACPLLLLLAQPRSLQLGQPPASCAAGAAAAICRRCAARLRRGPRSGKWGERPACGRAKSEGGRLVLGAAGAEKQGRTLPLTPRARDERALVPSRRALLMPKAITPVGAAAARPYGSPCQAASLPGRRPGAPPRCAAASCPIAGGAGAVRALNAAQPRRACHTAGKQGGAHRVLRAVQQPRSSAWRLHTQTQPAGPRAYSTQQAAAAMGCATASAPAAAGGRCRPRAAGACSGREACRQGVLRSSGCA